MVLYKVGSTVTTLQLEINSEVFTSLMTFYFLSLSDTQTLTHTHTHIHTLIQEYKRTHTAIQINTLKYILSKYSSFFCPSFCVSLFFFLYFSLKLSLSLSLSLTHTHKHKQITSKQLHKNFS